MLGLIITEGNSTAVRVIVHIRLSTPPRLQKLIKSETVVNFCSSLYSPHLPVAHKRRSEMRTKEIAEKEQKCQHAGGGASARRHLGAPDAPPHGRGHAPT